MAALTKIETNTLVGASEIGHRVEAMACDIVAEYGPDLVLAVILPGGFVFGADLLRALGRCGAKVEVEFIRPDAMSDDLPDLRGRRVLVAEAVLDSGRTATAVIERVRAHGGPEVRLAVLLDRPSRNDAGINADYVGFIIPDRYVVGYGITRDGRHAERSDVAAMD